jgi:Xaa-Pro aminopeptidase
VNAPALAKGLAELGATALVVVARGSQDPDLAPFVGPLHLGDAFLLAPAEGAPHLVYLTAMEREEAARTGLPLLHPEELEIPRLMSELPTEEQVLAAILERALARLGLAPGRLALAGSGRAGVLVGLAQVLSARGFTLLPGNRLALLARKRKDERQLDEARRVAAGGAAAMRRVADLLAQTSVRDGNELWLQEERLSVGRLKREIARVLAAFELEQPEGNIVAPAEEGAVPHSTGTLERVLRAGESLVVDLFPRGWLYADLTRTFCVGEPPPALAAGHAAVAEALERATRKLAREAETGTLRAFSLQQAVCAHFELLGYPTPLSHPGTRVGYVHNLGHGVGFDLHEYPSFRREAGEEGVVQAGDLLTLEPGLYDATAGWGVRLEDLVAVGTAGLENLTPLPYELDPRAWI